MDVEKKLNDFLNIEDTSEESSGELVEIPDINTSVENRKEDQSSDYNYARTNYYDLHEKGMKGLEELLELAKDSQNARSYEVAAGMIKNLGELNKSLIELQKDMNDLQGVEKKVPTNVTNALFVGSTADLQKMLKKQNSEKE
tara:strand:- start:3900 stop:4325 length:426 start_codon:yes stop_codon:yes gene_type:complete